MRTSAAVRDTSRKASVTWLHESAYPKMAAPGHTISVILSDILLYSNCNILRDFSGDYFFIFIHLHGNESQPYSWAHALVAHSNKGLGFIIAFFRGSSFLNHACTSVPSNRLPDLLHFNLMLIYEWYATVVTYRSMAAKYIKRLYETCTLERSDNISASNGYEIVPGYG